jgi:hypothetical protein
VVLVGVVLVGVVAAALPCTLLRIRSRGRGVAVGRKNGSMNQNSEPHRPARQPDSQRGVHPSIPLAHNGSRRAWLCSRGADYASSGVAPTLLDLTVKPPTVRSLACQLITEGKQLATELHRSDLRRLSLLYFVNC